MEGLEKGKGSDLEREGKNEGGKERDTKLKNVCECEGVKKRQRKEKSEGDGQTRRERSAHIAMTTFESIK